MWTRAGRDGRRFPARPYRRGRQATDGDTRASRDRGRLTLYRNDARGTLRDARVHGSVSVAWHSTDANAARNCQRDRLWTLRSARLAIDGAETCALISADRSFSYPPARERWHTLFRY